MLKPSVVLLAVIVSICLASFIDLCRSENIKCQIPVHYREIGCTPITKDGEKCPSSFNCDHLKSQDTSQCYHKGKPVIPGQHIAEIDLPRCVPYAYCMDGSFSIGHYDCGPLHQTLGQECVYTRPTCCANYVCGTEKIAELKVCYLEGKKFYGGEQINPIEDSCMECTCDEHFDNSTSIYKNQNCKAVNCNSEMFNLNDYRKGCAPMYYGKDRCCPSQTKCPSSDDTLIKAAAPHIDTALKCQFGDLELQLGDKVNHDSDKCISCECKTPPLVECHRIEGCKQSWE